MSTTDPAALRRAFGSFMTGITVVTTRDAMGAPVGFTANSFTSVSLDPPLLLVCPGKSLSSYDTFASCGRFAVNVLAEGQEDVSNTFAGFKGDRFAKVGHRLDAHRLPLIEGALAQFSCRTHQIVEAGDHCLLIGQVDTFVHTDGAGLGYANGRYFSLGLERDALGSTDREVVCGAIIEAEGHVLLEKTERGYRPPQLTMSDRVRLRESLQHDLTERGVDLRLGATYSVFDDARTHYAYILASAVKVSRKTTFEAVPISDLPNLTFASQPIATMMARFALESQTGDFSLYLGDTERGDVHRHSERN